MFCLVINENVHVTSADRRSNIKDYKIVDMVSFLFEEYRVSQKSLYNKKFEYLPYGSSKRADFFIGDRGMFKVYIHKDMPRKTLC